MASVEHLIEISKNVAAVTDQKIDRIHGITRRSRMLALNATIEAQRVGALGRGFAVVAEEVKSISAEISELTDSLRGELRGKLDTLSGVGKDLADQVRCLRGERLADMAHNTIEIADRNLYERSCDVRWWATDSAVVECVSFATPDAAAHAGKRLGVILDSYTVYLDLWIADASGRVLANGRSLRYPQVQGLDVSNQQWFKDAMATPDGNHFAVEDITTEPALNNSVVAVYSTAIRENGDANGKIIGALGIFFDWHAQAQAIVDGVRLSPEEKLKSRCILIDRNHRVIADSARHGLLREIFPLKTDNGTMGWYDAGHGQLVGYALTPGYETYEGLGWYGVIIQEE